MAVKQVFNTSAELDFPNVLPTLDLDFANSKTLDPRITFTRASGGSYVGADGLIKYAGVNEARFDHDPSTGESLGLLIEEARTNLLLRSEVFTFGNPWFYSNSSNITLNSIISPDGKNTAAKWSFDTQTLGRILGCPATVTANTNHTFSVYVKSAGLKYIAVFYGKSGSPFTRFGLNVNLLDGTFSNIDIGGPTSASIRKVDYFGDGWYRIQIGGIFDTTSTDGYVELRTRNINGTSENLVGDGVSGYYVWGAQLEQGAFPTSYIPTQASTRTRAVDIAQITGKNFSDFFNPTEGTVFVDYKTTGSGVALNIDNGGFPNRIQFTNIGGIAYVRNSTIIINNSHPFTLPGLDFKYATSYSNNKYIITRNGISISYPFTTEFRGGPPIGLANMRLGSYQGNAAKHNGVIRRVIYYPKFLSKEQHQALTS